MAEIRKTATIDAPADQVFAIIDDALNFPKYVPNVSEVVDLKRSGRAVGDSYRVIYKVLGLTFDEKFTTTSSERPTRITADFVGRMVGTFRWNLEPLGSQTRLSVDIEYTMPAGMLGKAVDSLLLERVNEKSIEGMLENLGRLAAKTEVATS
jgi:ribosome-associated toxin RatA of RatAB toxin-antitoxin module